MFSTHLFFSQPFHFVTPVSCHMSERAEPRLSRTFCFIHPVSQASPLLCSHTAAHSKEVLASGVFTNVGGSWGGRSKRTTESTATSSPGSVGHVASAGTDRSSRISSSFFFTLGYSRTYVDFTSSTPVTALEGLLLYSHMTLTWSLDR